MLGNPFKLVLSTRNNSNKDILKIYHTQASEENSGMDCTTFLIFTVILAKRQSICSNFFDQFSKRPWLPKSLRCFKSEMISLEIVFSPMAIISVLGHTYDVVKLYSCSVLYCTLSVYGTCRLI